MLSSGLRKDRRGEDPAAWRWYGEKALAVRVGEFHITKRAYSSSS